VKQARIGVIGLGEVAQIIHLPILQSLSDRYAIAAVCDVSPMLRSSIGDRYLVPDEARHADYRQLVARDDIDAVLVLNSDEYHADCAIAAARNGKHVLVEKPMCLTLAEADEIIAARIAVGVQVMVAYMRRYAPAFLQAVAEISRLGRINYVRVHDIIGRNRLLIDQSSSVLRPDDVPPELSRDKAERATRLVHEAIGEAPAELIRAYRLLCGLASHDLSAMRELLGEPRAVVNAVQWNGGNFFTALFEYDDYHALLETGVDEQYRFDAHIEVYGAERTLRIQYDTPYIRHLPTTLVIQDSAGDSYVQSVHRPTFRDPYTHELEAFHTVVTGQSLPKTTPEDFATDLRLFIRIVDVMRSGPNR
jgi:predicted dehydrogenase